MKKMKPVLVRNDVCIDVDLIPEYVAENLAQSALKAIQKSYNDPGFRAGYERRKAEREAKIEGEK